MQLVQQACGWTRGRAFAHSRAHTLRQPHPLWLRCLRWAWCVRITLKWSHSNVHAQGLEKVSAQHLPRIMREQGHVCSVCVCMPPSPECC